MPYLSSVSITHCPNSIFIDLLQLANECAQASTPFDGFHTEFPGLFLFGIWGRWVWKSHAMHSGATPGSSLRNLSWQTQESIWDAENRREVPPGLVMCKANAYFYGPRVFGISQEVPWGR